jgi:prevent-host-death family protein
MATVSIRDLRNHGGDVVDRVQAGETLVVTRSGKPVAELRPIRKPGMSAAALVARWHHMPRIDAVAFRADIDALIDPSL